MPKEPTTSRLRNTTSGDSKNREISYIPKNPQDIFKLTGQLMKLLNDRELGLEIYGRILDMLIDFFGIGAAAIRLKLSDDFPFFVTRGFSDRFVEEDNFICFRDQSGQIAYNEHGSARLRCFCGAVISQELVKTEIPLTGHGVFCGSGEIELDPSNRNLNVESTETRCSLEGFKSLILTPIRSSGGISGLLIMADSTPMRLTEELNTLLEILSFGLGVAVDRLIPPVQPQQANHSDMEKLFKALFDLGPTGIAASDIIDYRFIRINDRFCEMTGYSREELMELTILDVTHPDDLAHELRLMEDVLSNQIPTACYEKRILTKDRKTVWARVTECAIMDDSNRPALVLGMIENIEERKTAQNRLETLEQEQDLELDAKDAEIKKLNVRLVSKVSEKKSLEEELKIVKTRFKAISEGLGDIVFFKGPDLTYAYVNSAMARTFGLNPRDIIGKTSYDIFSVQSADLIKQTDLRVLSGETIENEALHWINGSKMYFQEHKSPVKSSNGQIIGILGLIRNITDRKKSQRVFDNRSLDYPSTAMKATMEKAAFAAETDSIVLLEGESGSGKDHIARWIHENSKRSSGPFLGINCAALPHELAESELFGHEQGAFTGARGRKRGLLELAEGGTLLLNEIGELSLSLQTKLLTFLDTRCFMRVGGEKSIKVNARLMAATHRDLKEEVTAGRFERALFYRLNVFSINIPPLRERVDDLPILINELITKLAEEIQLHEIPQITTETLTKLAQYDWPGNVRELRNAVERGLMLSRGPSLMLPAPILEGSDLWSHKIAFPDQQDLNELVRDIRISLCNEALRRASGNRSRAAALLGVSRDAFYRYLKAGTPVSDPKTSLDV